MSDVVVLVSAIDKYAACWEPLCHSFKKYWPDCPWPLKFVTNGLDAPCGESIKVGTTEWTAMNREGLQRAGAPVILWMLEDFWFTRPVDTAAMVDFANLVVSGKADYIRCCRQCDQEPATFSRGDFPDDPRLYILGDAERYRTSLQIAFWRVQTFLGLLRDGENAWQFEVEGSIRSRGNRKFLCVRECKYVRYTGNVDPEWNFSAMSHGEWTPTAYVYAQREGVPKDVRRHPKEGI